MVPFAGWEMPVQFGGIVDEHRAVRERAGLFDVSHMGEIRLRGSGALGSLQRLTVNDASVLEAGRAQYTAMTNETGGILDDLLVYRLGEEDWLMVVNAACRDKDVAWVHEHAGPDTDVRDESDEWAQLAVQGPAAAEMLSDLVGPDVEEIGYYRFVRTEIDGAAAIVSRTGYTGEDGFEIYLAPDAAASFADAVMEAGDEHGIVPAGLGARDTLRLEAGMLLYGNDMDESRTPVEARLGWIVKPDKGEFLGRDRIVEQLEEGTAERLVGLEVEGRGIPRPGYAVAVDEERVGTVTSGTFSPTLEVGIGLAYVRAEHAQPETAVELEIRDRRVPARIVKTPFYRRER